jgi:hypothetical protein
VWFILELYITQILISTTSRFECISRLIKVTDNNDERWKLEIGNLLLILMPLLANVFRGAVTRDSKILDSTTTKTTTQTNRLSISPDPTAAVRYHS